MSMLHMHCADTGWELLAVAMFVYRCVFDHSMFIGNICPEYFHFIGDKKDSYALSSFFMSQELQEAKYTVGASMD